MKCINSKIYSFLEKNMIFVFFNTKSFTGLWINQNKTQNHVSITLVNS